MNNEILKVLYHNYTDLDFSAEGIAPFGNEEWQKETAALNEFAEQISLSDSDRASLEIDVICGFMYKSGLEGFINGFKLATRLFVGK